MAPRFLAQDYPVGQSSSGSDEEGDLSPDKNLLSSESESEEESSESESETESPRQSMHPADNGLAALVAIVFICFWQSAFRLPDIAIDMLLKFLVGFIKQIFSDFFGFCCFENPSSIYRI